MTVKTQDDGSPKYPDVRVRLIDEDGNAMMIIGRVRRALRRHGVEKRELDAYAEEAMSSDYQNVLKTTMDWVSVE